MTNTDIRTIADVNDIIQAGLRSDDADLHQHARTLLGARTRGSITSRGLGTLPADTPVEKIRHPNVESPVECYRVHAPSLGGRVSAGALIDALRSSKGVVTRHGEHGPELVAVEPDRIWRDEVNCGGEMIYILIGEHKGQRTVFTWHPGEPLKPYDPDKALNARTGVKLD